MAFIFTPGQIARRASFYHQLASLLVSGISLTRGLDVIQGSRSGGLGKGTRELLRRLQSGETLSQAVHQMPAWIPEFDAALLAAGEQSGRLDATLRNLGDYYDERARLLRRLILSLIYPLVLVHMMILIFPIGELVRLVQTFEAGPFFASKLKWLALIYGGIALVVFCGQTGRGAGLRLWIERFQRRVPVLGGATRSLALARLSLALESMINAGVNIIPAWDTAARASGSLLLRREVESWRDRMEAGETPAELVLQSREFPTEFSSQYYSGEISGKLDETLSRLHAFFSDEARRKMTAAAMALSAVIFTCVVIAVAYFVVTFYIGYFGNILEAL